MRGFWTYVGVYAIAGVIDTLVLVLVQLVLVKLGVDLEPLDRENLLVAPIAITLNYSIFSLPFVYAFNRWLYRFGFVKGTAAIHLIALFAVFFLFSILFMLSGESSFTEKILGFAVLVLLFIFFFFVYVLPITLGAIIMKWLTQNLSQVKRLVSVDYCMYTLGESFKKKIKIILRSI